MNNNFSKKILLFLFIFFIITPLSKASADIIDEEMKILELYYKKKDLVITPTRHPQGILQVAENITVITSEDLEMVNAHTLTDALNNITGVQMDIKGGPGSGTNAYVQGYEYRHVLVMIDGVVMNNLSENYADIGAIPVQNIKRIEIIKGPASSSWGSSLGGIIHIITKSPRDSGGVAGTWSVFHGEKETTDYRAEASGTTGNLGYYFYTGNLQSEGLTEYTPYDEDNLYTKLNWNIKDKGSLLFSLGYNKGSRNNYTFVHPNGSMQSEQDTFKYLFSTLTLEHPINRSSEFKLSLRLSNKDLDRKLSMGPKQFKLFFDDSTYGGSIDLTWRHGINNILLGFDFDKGKLESELSGIKDSNQNLKKWAVFLNSTTILNKLSLTYGIRYDYTNTNGDNVSPSLGITYKVTERNLLRGYFAEGFHIPPLGYTFGIYPGYEPNPDLKVEKVRSIQVGIESTALKYIWFKTTFFHHNIWDGIFDKELFDPNNIYIGKTTINKEKQKRQGIEVELKTIPVYNTSLFTGFSFIDAKDRDTGKKLLNSPKHTYDIGVQYDNNKSFWASLTGHYISWNADRVNNTQDGNFIWDINFIKDIHWDMNLTIKTFLTIHNIFNSSQYLMEAYKNPGRWTEAGLKFKF